MFYINVDMIFVAEVHCVFTFSGFGKLKGVESVGISPPQKILSFCSLNVIRMEYTSAFLMQNSSNSRI